MNKLDAFIQQHMRKGKALVPARLQTALGLLEKVREDRSIHLPDHLAARGSSGLESHETWGDKAHDRFTLEAINKNHGRRSSSLQDWGQALLDLLGSAGFADASPEKKNAIIDELQSPFAAALRYILEQEPIQARIKGRTAEAVIRDVLEQAQDKGKSGDVAQYLVAAKLMIRLDVEIPTHGANKKDRKGRGDRQARLGDIEIADAIIEIAVGLPDDFHLDKINDAIAQTDKEVWLLTRAHRVKTWQDELKGIDGLDLKRVVVQSVEGFVGQNVTELGRFSTKGRAAQLAKLFNLYNDRWIAAVGTPGIRIESLA